MCSSKSHLVIRFFGRDFSFFHCITILHTFKLSESYWNCFKITLLIQETNFKKISLTFLFFWVRKIILKKKSKSKIFIFSLKISENFRFPPEILEIFNTKKNPRHFHFFRHFRHFRFFSEISIFPENFEKINIYFFQNNFSVTKKYFFR